MATKTKPGVEIIGTDADEEIKNVEDQEFSEEETTNQMRMEEEDFIQGLIASAGDIQEETQVIEIAREGKVYFRFSIHPLSEDEYDRCKKKWTKYVRNKQIGLKVPSDTNNVKYRDDLIYRATVEEDRAKLWDNKQVWDTLNSKGLQIMNGLDVIEYSIKAGEKDRVLDCIDKLSGYDGSNLEEVAKN